MGAVDTVNLLGRSAHLSAVPGSNKKQKLYSPDRSGKIYIGEHAAVENPKMTIAEGQLAAIRILWGWPNPFI
jgi:hypothetical protein